MIKDIIQGLIIVIVAVVISVMVGGNQSAPIGGATGQQFRGTITAIDGIDVGSRQEFSVDRTGALTINERTGTTTAYLKAVASSKGGRLILEDSDGAGCSELYALNGSLTTATVTCP